MEIVGRQLFWCSGLQELFNSFNWLRHYILFEFCVYRLYRKNNFNFFHSILWIIRKTFRVKIHLEISKKAYLQSLSTKPIYITYLSIFVCDYVHEYDLLIIMGGGMKPSSAVCSSKSGISFSWSSKTSYSKSFLR